MEIKTGTDVYNNLNYSSVQTGHGREYESSVGEKSTVVNSADYSEPAAAIYEKSEQSNFLTYSVNSVQPAADSAVIAKMRAYLNDLGFYDGQLSGGYTEELKTALKCFQNAYFGRQTYNVESGIPSGLQGTIQSVGAAYYTNLTNSRLNDALKKLGFNSSNSAEAKKNFARIQTFFQKGMGCNKYQIAGIMGNIMQESWFSPTSERSNGAFGILQWLGPRRTYLNDYTAKNGYSNKNIGAQFAFFRYEVNAKWGTDCLGGYAQNSHLVDAWKTLKNEHKYSFYDVSDYFMSKIEGTNQNQQERRNYSSIIYQAIS